ncbi:hypothetical protein [Metabacillus halosaccharovorans]|uniref:hypothetical protein n=1 Tax=Metabacillus halosaccharovorans TaxID=930124 RepID=UPI001C1F2C93|nr:hypothetical protein [Metabacillus halosaccharovorans]MBU7595537.1 hypothetical protein [Metabacillus halosaccharovorans]
MKKEIVEAIVDEVVEGIYEAFPMLVEKYGEVGKNKCREDNHHHFKHLDTAFSLNEEKVFTDYALWLNNVLTSRGMKEDHLIDNFNRIKQALHTHHSDEAIKYKQYLQSAIETIEHVIVKKEM